MNEIKRALLKELLEEKHKEGARVRLIEMKGEKQMEKGLCGTIDHVDDGCQIHVNWDNGSTLALQPEIDRFEVLEEEKEKKIEIPVFGGTIVAERNPDAMYDGVCVYFQEKTGIVTDIVTVEAKEELDKKQIDVYTFENIHSEDYSRKISIRVEDILKLTSKEQNSYNLDKWLRICLDAEIPASKVLNCEVAREELTEDEIESLIDILGK